MIWINRKQANYNNPFVGLYFWRSYFIGTKCCIWWEYGASNFSGFETNPRQPTPVRVWCDYKMCWTAFCWIREERAHSPGLRLRTNLSRVVAQTKSPNDFICGARVLPTRFGWHEIMPCHETFSARNARLHTSYIHKMPLCFALIS